MPSEDVTQRPVFILGAARSGTSAVAQGLLKCGEFQGFEEGHLLWVLQRFLDMVHSFYEFNGEDASGDRFTMLSHTPFTYLTSGARAMLVAAMAHMFPTCRWIDKTPRPEMIAAARLMQEMWPNARFVFMKRRGIENVISRLSKFPQLSFDDHCHDWAKSMSAWLSVRDLLGAAAIEIEQIAIAKAPQRAALAIGEFLDIPEDATNQLCRSLMEDLPERTSDSHALSVDLTTIGWTTYQIAQFRRICGAMMAAYGYGYTSNYFASPVASISLERTE